MENIINPGTISSRNYLAYWKEFLTFVLLIMALFFVISISMPIQYKSTASILITQKDQSGLNAYTEVKSAEFNGKIIEQIILSNSFMEGVINSNEAAKNYLNSEANLEKRIAKWRDSINIDQVSSTGVLNISFFYPNKVDSKNILNSMLELLQKNGQDYFGNPNIGIKIVNKPYYINTPASPKVFLSVAIGGLLGICIIIFAIQLFNEKFFWFLFRIFGYK